MAKEKSADTNKKLTINEIVSRFIIGMVIMFIVTLTPLIGTGNNGAFSKENLLTILVAVIILTVLDYVLLKVFKLEANVFGKGLVGFILSAAILFATGKIIGVLPESLNMTFDVGPVGAAITALVYGILDAIIPGKTFFSN